MKKIIILSLMLVSACAEKPLDVEQAKQVVENLILLADKEEYEAVAHLYTPAFNESEPIETKKEKLGKLRMVLGPVEKMEFISATNVAQFGEAQHVEVKYKITHSNATTIEMFSVYEEEGGYKVGSHKVETER